MTSNSLFTKDTNPKVKNSKMNRPTKGKGSLLRHATGSYWWLAFACGVVYFFAGPVFTMLYLNGMNFDATHYDIPAVLHQQNVEQIARWMSGEGMLPLYLSAVVLSMILGCVMFAYLQHKRQVNFYHSQPIHRTRLFLNQYVVGFTMNMVLMLAMLVLSMLIVVMYGLGEALTVGAILRHVGNIFVLSLASYSISVLAGQLTGTVLTHLALMIVMHFAVPLATVIVTYMGDIFLATCDTTFPVIALYFSPICAMTLLLTEYSTCYLMYMTAPAMGTSLVMILLIIGVGFAVLSWYLYQKRPSEATGKSLIYPITEPFVKAYLMFVGALGCGYVFYAVGSKAFFYFAVITFAILIHMVCQVIIEHDFKAIFYKMKQCVVITVLICAVVGVARFDLLGFDRYLPEPTAVKAVVFELNGVDDYYGTPIASEDEQVKMQVYTLLQPVVEHEMFRSSQFDGYRNSFNLDDGETRSSVRVTYTLNSGREVTRRYRDVPVSQIQDHFATLYNIEAYRESYYAPILKATADHLSYMNIGNTTIYSPSASELRTNIAHYIELSYAETYDVYDVVVDQKAVPITYAREVNHDLPDYNSQSAKQLAGVLLEAYKADLLDRSFSVLEEVEVIDITINVIEDNDLYAQRGYSSYHHSLPVYPSDKRTMAILDQYEFAYVNDYNYDKLLVFRCEPMNENTLRATVQQALYNNEKIDNKDGLFSEAEVIATMSQIGELTGRVEGQQAVNKFIADTKLLRSGSMFSTMDESHFVLLQYNHVVDGTDGREWRSTLFYSDTVPVEYR